MALCTDAVNRFLDLRLMGHHVGASAGSIDSATTAEMYTLIKLLTAINVPAQTHCPVSDRQQGGNGGTEAAGPVPIGSWCWCWLAKNAAGNQDGDASPSPRPHQYRRDSHHSRLRGYRAARYHHFAGQHGGLYRQEQLRAQRIGFIAKSSSYCRIQCVISTATRIEAY